METINFAFFHTLLGIWLYFIYSLDSLIFNRFPRLNHKFQKCFVIFFTTNSHSDAFIAVHLIPSETSNDTIIRHLIERPQRV